MMTNRISAGVLCLTAALLVGCTAGNQTPTNTASTAPPTASNAATPAPSPSASVDTSQITVPVLAAMLSDEDFVNSAKNEQKLSDTDIQKLRDAVQAAGGTLDENAPENARSTRAAAKSASDLVDQVLGKERGHDFLALVQKRW